MKNSIRYLLILLSTTLLVSCEESGGGLSNVELTGCEIDQQNRFVHEVMKEFYLWYQEVPETIDYSDFSSPQQTLDFLRYDFRDPPNGFSYITSQSSFENLFAEGQFLGFGFSFTTDTSGRVWVRFVYDDSPAGRAGMQRGDEIISVNGQTLISITSNPGWSSIFGPDEEGYEVNMVLGKVGTTNRNIQMQKTVVNINTVLHSSVVSGAAVPTGYLAFKSFLSTSNAELDQVFEQFESAGVSRVILDLRYNGGGSVAVANNLASYLNRPTNDTSLFSRLVYNDKNQAQNSSFNLQQFSDGLNLDQLIVITTGETCSASEMIINGLSPYVTVKTVGSTTCGKPVGQNPFFFCSNALLPVTFETENRDGVGDYFAGIGVDCAASDDVDLDFGDTSDPMLAQALHLAENGSCQTTLRASREFAPTTKATGTLREIIGAI